MSEIVFAKESLPHLMTEVSDLITEHYEEITHYKDIELAPDWDAYLRVYESGGLRCYTARKEDKLVGYCIFFIKHNMHYKNSLQASQDILFITKEQRGRGGRFIKWCDEELKEEGVQVVYHHVKKKHNFGPLLERFGYDLVDLIYAKRLDK